MSASRSRSRGTAGILPELLSATARGQYSPSPGSAGAVLLQAHPSTDRWVALRSLRIFAKVAYKTQGLWWPMALESDPDLLAELESDYLAISWKMWIAGYNPFSGAGRVTS